MEILKREEYEEVVCKKCGAIDNQGGDRFYRFILPHFKAGCGQDLATILELYIWRPITGQAPIGLPLNTKPTFGAKDADMNISSNSDVQNLR